MYILLDTCVCNFTIAIDNYLQGIHGARLCVTKRTVALHIFERKRKREREALSHVHHIFPFNCLARTHHCAISGGVAERISRYGAGRYSGLRSLGAGENVIMKRRSTGRDRAPRAWWMFSASAPRLLRITDVRAREYRHVDSLPLSLSLALLEVTPLPIYAPTGQPFYVNRVEGGAPQEPPSRPFGLSSAAGPCPSMTLKWLFVRPSWQSGVKHSRQALCVPIYRMNFVCLIVFGLDFNSVCVGHNYQIIINVIYPDLTLCKAKFVKV